MSLLPHLCDLNPIITFNNNGIIVIDNFYTNYDCEKIIKKIDEFKESIYQNNKRRGITVQNKLANIIETIISGKIDTDNGWTFDSVNPNFRWIVGDPNYFMTKHLDENIIKNINIKSLYSVIIYLNDDEGDLVFPELNLSFQQKAGRLIIFKQSLLHLSKPCKNSKYFLHSEVFFTNTNLSNDVDEKEDIALNLYFEYINNKDLTKLEEACKICKKFDKLFYS